MKNNFSLYNSLIFVGENSFHALDKYIRKEAFSDILILVDENSKNFCLPILLSNVSCLKNSQVCEIQSGERNKSLIGLNKIFAFFLSKGFDNNSLILNLGGGVICDLGGFAASVLKRGVRFVNIPTSLMAQVDAAVGGKVGVNFNNNKNQIGLFSLPELVLVYPEFTNSLPRDHFMSAYSEIFKYALIFDKSFWLRFRLKENLNHNRLEEIIVKCLKIKIEIVSSDFYDKKNRRKLNFGHSIAHAIESVFLFHNKEISHGNALAVGLICETFLSYQKFQFSDDVLKEVVQTIKNCFKSIHLPKIYDNKVLEYLASDKKNISNQYNFTLIKNIGQSVVNCDMLDVDILRSLDYYRELCQV